MVALGGNISYSYYLIHGLARHFFAKSLRYVIGTGILPAPAFVLMGAIAMLVTIVGGALLYLAVEKPLSLSSPKAAAAKGPRPVGVPEPIVPSEIRELEPVRRTAAD